MKKSRIILYIALLIVFSFGAYAAFMYVYTEWKFLPITLLQEPNLQAPHSEWKAMENILYIHKVNTPRRAESKEKSYDGYELDIYATPNETLTIAHDPEEIADGIKLADIFAAIDHPEEKSYWLDLKTEFTQPQLEQILLTAKSFGIPPENLLLETVPGPTAKLIKEKGLGLLLQLPSDFDDDSADPQKRKEINEKALKQWQEYLPAAVSASFGKYPYLRDYFPNMPKAIYYSSTIRPSLKKPFMIKHMKEDPSVKIFMIDEYTWYPSGAANEP